MMNRKLRRTGMVFLLLFLLVFLFSLPLSAAPQSGTASADGPPTLKAQPDGPRQPIFNTTSAADEAVQRLSPDLRALVGASGKAANQLVFVLVQPGTSVTHLLQRSAVGRPVGGVQWVTGEVAARDLVRLASVEGVIAVTSTRAFQPLPAPGLEKMRGATFSPLITSERAAELLALGGKQAVMAQVAADNPQTMADAPQRNAESRPRSGDSVKVADIHSVNAAHDAGYTGQGVVAAVVDTGVDFAHPDLQGRQARVVGGPYDGWPYAYDTLSGANYAMGGFSRGPDNYWVGVTDSQYVHTFPVEGAECDGTTCVGELMIDFGDTVPGNNWPSVTLPFSWPDTSKSGAYYYTVYPVFDHLFRGFLNGMGYASIYDAPAAIIVADEATAGQYDTVYIDSDFDQDLTAEKPARKGDELTGADINDSAYNWAPDGYWDLSTSMLTWIADGTNPPPGVGVLYSGVQTPQAGRLLAFVSDAETHGTNVASMIAAQSVITDPDLMSSINPLFAGGENAGGVGGPVLAGMAPDATIAAFMNGFILPYDAWTLAVLGFDGVAESGDEAQIVNNSWGDSMEAADGWDVTSRYAQFLNRNFAPTSLFLAATGNGGPGYGTTTSPNGGSIFKVGASTSYSTSDYFELVGPEQFTWGAVQPWSNRGPGSLGDVDPDLVCVGAYGMGATPLNRFSNGQASYDLFGGTSMASPVCAGIAALSYQAFHDAHNRWPTWQEATDILNNGGDDLGYNVLAQGAGNANALRSATIAAGETAWVTPSQWLPGDYRGEDFTPGFPAVVHAGDTVSAPLTIHNPTDAAQTFALSDVNLQRVHEITFTVTLGAGNKDSDPIYRIPDYLQNITGLIDEYDPDLIRAHTLIPYGVFDRGGDYSADNTVTSLFYDWTDLNENGTLWVDGNDNGLVEPEELDVERGTLGAYEINRYTYAYATSNYDVVDIGRDALSRQHDGVYFGLMRGYGTDDIQVTVSLIFYKKADWDWLSLSTGSVTVPTGGEADVTATMTVPAGARPGLYEGAVEYDGQVIPVVAHVAGESATFEFGATSTDEPLGDTPHDNGHVFGSTDWDWRPETGDWRHYFYDLPDGTAGPGTVMMVETEWVNPDPDGGIPFPPLALYEGFEEGIPWDWNVIDNAGSCVWTINDPLSIPNYTGGEGYTATADSATCGPDTVLMDTEMHTPSIDLSAVDEAWLMFRADFYPYTDEFGEPLDHAWLDVSTNGGTTWEALLDIDYPVWGPATIFQNLSAYAGEPDVMLRFRYMAQGWHAWWQVDDVSVFLGDPRPAIDASIPALTDIDTAIFGATEEPFSSGDPDFFGPTGLAKLGASRNTLLYGGTWAFQTATGGPREVVGAPMSDGLGLITLHNVLNAGLIVGEPVAGRAYQLTVDPAPLEAEADRIATANPLQLSAEWDVTVESTADLPEGLSITGFGLSNIREFTDQPIGQDDPSDACTAQWVEEVVATDSALMEITMSAAAPALDVDLYLVLDGGDGVFNCVDDILVAASAKSGSAESVSVTFPPDGRYFVVAHGWSVPGGSGLFDITIRNIQGNNVIVHDLPSGPIAAGEPITFGVEAMVDHEPGAVMSGLLFIGPTDAPLAMNLPITVTVPEPSDGRLLARLSVAPDAVKTGESAAFSLWVSNQGAEEEAASVTINVPSGLVLVPGSAAASVGQATIDLLNRKVTWQGILEVGQSATITFDATASTFSGRADVRAKVTGAVRNTTTNLSVPVWINTPRPPTRVFGPVVGGH